MDNGVGAGSILNSKVGSSHGLVGARLSLFPTHRSEDLLCFLDVQFVCPAMNESVCDIWCHFDVSSCHVTENGFSVGNMMVGNHGLEESLIEAGLGSN